VDEKGIFFNKYRFFYRDNKIKILLKKFRLKSSIGLVEIYKKYTKV